MVTGGEAKLKLQYFFLRLQLLTYTDVISSSVEHVYT